MCQTIRPKIIGVDDIEIYKCENFQCELPIISGSTKYNKSGKISNVRICTLFTYPDLDICHFCPDQTITNILLIFCTALDIYIIYI